MALFLTPIELNIKKELDARSQFQSTDNRSGDALNWSYGKIPWTRMISNAIIDTTGDGKFDDKATRTNYTLFLGIGKGKNADKTVFAKTGLRGGFEQIYNDPQVFGGREGLLKPMPGITNATIENKGELGSIRRATVNFTCWNIQQLEVLQKLYMTPGISVVLEWGWSNYDGNLMSPLDTITSDPAIFTRRARKRIGLIKGDASPSRAGLYDTMRGLVLNFSWTVRQDGGFDCTTEFSSQGEIMHNVNIHSKSKGIVLSNQDSENPTIKTNIQATLDNITGNKPGSITTQQDSFKKPGIDLVNKIEILAGQGLYPKISTLAFSGGFAVPPKADKYVSWGYLEEYLINQNLSYVNDKGEQVVALRSTDTITKESVQITNDRNIRSCDIKVCLLPGQINFEGSTGWNVSPEFKSFAADQDKVSGFVRNILVHTDLIAAAIEKEGNDRLGDFIMYILDKINRACGLPWDFRLQVDENDPNTLKVIDANYTDPNFTKDKESGIEYKFDVFNKNSIVKNFNVTTKVPDALKSSIFYGSNKKRTQNKEDDEFTSKQFAQFASDTGDFVNEGIELPGRASGIENESEQAEVATTKDTLEKAYKVMYKDRTDDNANTAVTAMNKYIMESKTSKGTNIIDKILIPFDMELTLDGISGIYFGNVITTNYLPTNYRDSVIFQVTNVKHEITPEAWSTSLSTVMRIKTS